MFGMLYNVFRAETDQTFFTVVADLFIFMAITSVDKKFKVAIFLVPQLLDNLWVVLL